MARSGGGSGWGSGLEPPPVRGGRFDRTGGETVGRELWGGRVWAGGRHIVVQAVSFRRKPVGSVNAPP